MKINDIVVAPVLTEKATKLAQNKVYMFWVNKQAPKPKIKQVLEQLYSVKIGRITSFNRKGKTTRVGRKMTPKKKPDKKIVYIHLTSGKIDLFPQA